jgi:4-hydroxybenzoate polyprenyltransferase
MAVAEAPTPLTTPLCVDLDGTLIRSDLLLESLLVLIKRNPLYVFYVPLWLLRGKSFFKAAVAARVSISPAALAYDRKLLDWLTMEHEGGRPLWLCTAVANEHLAGLVAAHLKMFAGVLADGNQAARLVEHFGAGRFEYCANTSSDLTTGTQVRAAVRALRPHQWAKNVLLFVPLLAAHRLADASALATAGLAFLAFCACASSVYVLNDLLDLEADRSHPRKSKRPFACGDLSIGVGLSMVPCLLAVAVAVALLLPPRFAEILATYFALTSAYSFYLKRFMLIDALALAGLYTLRIIAGAAAVDVPLSFWMLLFSVFLFLSLAFVKRFAELDTLRRHQGLHVVGRGYRVEDLSVLQSLGSAAGYLSVLVLALYINSPEIGVLYHRPKFVWVLCVLMLYWISRVWMMAQRGHMHDDPVVFALKDRQSLAIGLAAAITVGLAI